MYMPYMTYMVVDVRKLAEDEFISCQTDDEFQTKATPLLKLSAESQSPEAKRLMQNMNDMYRSDFLRAIRDQAELTARFDGGFTSKDITVALQAYESVMEMADNELTHCLKTAVVMELSLIFGPSSHWIMMINDKGQLDAIDVRNFEDENLKNGFRTDDGYRLVFNQTEGIWTDGDLEFNTVYGKPGIFGWPVDCYGRPLSGLITLI